MHGVYWVIITESSFTAPCLHDHWRLTPDFVLSCSSWFSESLGRRLIHQRSVLFQIAWPSNYLKYVMVRMGNKSAEPSLLSGKYVGGKQREEMESAVEGSLEVTSDTGLRRLKIMLNACWDLTEVKCFVFVIPWNVKTALVWLLLSTWSCSIK